MAYTSYSREWQLEETQCLICRRRIGAKLSKRTWPLPPMSQCLIRMATSIDNQGGLTANWKNLSHGRNSTIRVRCWYALSPTLYVFIWAELIWEPVWIWVELIWGPDGTIYFMYGNDWVERLSRVNISTFSLFYDNIGDSIVDKGIGWFGLWEP